MNQAVAIGIKVWKSQNQGEMEGKLLSHTVWLASPLPFTLSLIWKGMPEKPNGHLLCKKGGPEFL